MGIRAGFFLLITSDGWQQRAESPGTRSILGQLVFPETKKRDPVQVALFGLKQSYWITRTR